MSKPSREVLRLARPLPIVGQIASLAYSRETLNEKGAGLGGLDIALDLIPFVGRMKGLFEIFGGDVITEENLKRGFTRVRAALDEVETLCGIQNNKETTALEANKERSSTRRSESAQKVDAEINRIEAAIRADLAAAQATDEGEMTEVEPRYYPENSAKTAALRAKAAIKPAYERRVYPGLQADTSN